jgi:hypothetical protein
MARYDSLLQIFVISTAYTIFLNFDKRCRQATKTDLSRYMEFISGLAELFRIFITIVKQILLKTCINLKMMHAFESNAKAAVSFV